MSSKFRDTYDRLYAGVETWLLARGAVKDAKARAASAENRPELSREYKTAIVPYWKQYRVKTPKPFWFALHADRSTPADPHYIPDDLWFHRIVPYYNNIIFAKALQDKCLPNVLFPHIKHPVTVVKNMAGVFYADDLTLLSPAQAVAAVHGHGRIIAKPSVGSGQGHSIRFYDSNHLTAAEIEDIFRLYGQNFILQEKLPQHEVIARFNPHSLNTVRVVTFLHGGDVHILSTILRIGGGTNEVDNVSQGGYQCTILPNGQLDSYAITKRNGRWQQVTETAAGVPFAGTVIPSFDRILDLLKLTASRMAHFKIIGWDIALDPAGDPVIIEYNVIPGQNQGTCGPTFGAMTDTILAEVFGTHS